MELSAKNQQALDRAMDYHSRGKLDEAADLYRSVLENLPQQADALHYLGVIDLQRGRFTEAVDLIRKAVIARPDYIDAISNLGYSLNALGQHEAAVEQFEHALSIGPETAILLSNLGGSLERLGRYKEAALRFEEALRLQPDLAETRRSLADVLLVMGQVENALQEISKAMAAAPVPTAMQVSFGNILFAADRIDEATQRFEKVLQAHPESLEIRESFAGALRKAGRSDAAAEQLEILLQQDPGNVDAQHKLGVAYQDMNEKDKALAAFRRAVQLDRTCAKAWHGLSAVSRRAFDERDIGDLLSLQQDTGISIERQMLLAFALGRHFENAGEHDAAAGQYLRANRLTRGELDYDLDSDLRKFSAIHAQFDVDFLDQWKGVGSSAESPIFVVGMHRSGTTLVEQVLASHPDVFGAGEIALLTQSIVATFPVRDDSHYTSSLDEASAEHFRRIGNDYLNGLPNVELDFTVDKLPLNFFNIGMIQIVFPRASIVHCRRDPRDTCFSIFKNLFGKDGYQFELRELAHYYNAYAALMNHWEEVMPGRVHTVDYEAMIGDQERTTRDLLDACGLEWNRACLDFHKHERSIATISATQVRQPLYASSIGAWKPYKKMLQPLLEILQT